MSMGRVSSNGVKERIGQLCSESLGAEAGPRFTAAGDALVTLVEVLEQEAEDRRQRRIIRIRRASAARRQDMGHLRARQGAGGAQTAAVADGSFVERGVNVLAFGLPGTGKTHAVCAIGHGW